MLTRDFEGELLSPNPLFDATGPTQNVHCSTESASNLNDLENFKLPNSHAFVMWFLPSAGLCKSNVSVRLSVRLSHTSVVSKGHDFFTIW